MDKLIRPQLETVPEPSRDVEGYIYDPSKVGIQHGPYSIDPGIESSLIDKRDRLGSRVDLYANAQDEMVKLRNKRIVTALGCSALSLYGINNGFTE